MRTFLKLSLILVGGLAALFVVAIIAVSLFFDPNDYKDEVRDLVREQTGRELDIQGDISMSYFPWIGVEAGPATLSNAQGFEPPHFARIERAGVKVKLLPLIRRQVEVDTIILNGAHVNLARNAQGVSNWQDLIPEEEQPSDTETAGAGIAGLVVSGVQLRDSTVVWNDAQSGTQYTAGGIDLNTSQVALGEPFDLQLGFDLASDTGGMDARVTVNARPTVSKDFQQARLEDFEFKLKGGQQGEEGATPLDIELRADAAVNLADGTASLNELALRAWNVAATGNGSLSGLNTQPRYNAELSVEEFSPRRLIETLTGTAPDTSDTDVMNRAAARLTLEGGAGSARLQVADAYLDDTEVTGTYELVAFAPMASRFNLRIGSIDVDRYLSPEQREASDDAPVATPGEAAAAGGSLIPVETLRGLDMQGEIHADEFRIAGLTATDIRVTINAKDGLVRMHPLEASFYQGKYTGDIRIDARSEEPQLSMDERLQGVSAGPLLTDAAGRAWMTGIGGLRLQSTADLSSPETAKQSLSGSFSMDFSDGAIFGINIAQRIRQAAAMLQGDSVSLSAEEQKTDFSSFTINALMESGVIRAETIQLISPLLEITGGGTVSLVDDVVDMSFRPVLKGALEGVGGETVNKLVGRPIPLRFSGSITSPSINFDLAAALQGEVRDRLGQEVLRRLEKQESEQPGEGSGDGETGQGTEEASAEDRLKREALRRLLGGDDEKEDAEDEAGEDDSEQQGDNGDNRRQAARSTERRTTRPAGRTGGDDGND